MRTNARRRSLTRVLASVALAAPLALASVVSSTPAHAAPPAGGKARPQKKGGLVLDLPIQEFKLDNGMRVYIVEDKSTPAFNISILYDVGSIDEVKGQTGLAHFFEHMMFMGSENLGKFMIGTYTEQAGGNLNAGTSYDYTIYYHNIPSNYLDMVLWAESDRLKGLDLRAEPFEVQRAAVISEKDLGENQPYSKDIQWGFIPDVLVGSPYEHSVIGYEEDLKAMKLEWAQAFFDTYYKPNNAVMVIVGDVDFAEAKGKIEKYFGAIPGGPAKPPVNWPAERKRQKIEKKIADEKAQQTIYLFGWRTVPDDHPDRWATDLMASILLGGASSRVPKSLTDEKKLTVASGGFHFVFRGDGMIFAQAVPSPGKTADEIKAAMREQVDLLKTKGVSKAELEKAINQRVMQTVSTLATNQGRATAIAQGALFYNDPKRVLTDLERYRQVTVADIQRVANSYLDDNVVFYEIGPG
jgi:zinc protease